MLFDNTVLFIFLWVFNQKGVVNRYYTQLLTYWLDSFEESIQNECMCWLYTGTDNTICFQSDFLL